MISIARNLVDWLCMVRFLGQEPNMLRVEEPVIIIGDIHGQFFDMIHMFEKVVDAKGIPG